MRDPEDKFSKGHDKGECSAFCGICMREIAKQEAKDFAALIFRLYGDVDA